MWEVLMKNNPTFNVENIKKLVHDASNSDNELKVFGAKSHKYEFNDVVSMEEINTFEEKYCLKLPEEYVYFLTNVGNGGAGPHYGIYSLEQMESHNYHLGKVHFNLEEEPFINKNLNIEEWNAHCESMENDDYYEANELKTIGGVLIIGTRGCTYDNLLIITGEDRGKMIYMDWNEMADCPPAHINMTFGEWYLGFFQEIIQQNSVRAYGMQLLDSEETLMEKWKATKDLDVRRKIFSSLNRFGKLSADTIQYFNEISDDEELLATKLLLKYSEANGIKKFENYLYSAQFKLALSIIRLIPSERRNDYYDFVVQHINNKEKAVDRNSLLYYFSDCSMRKAADIVDFVLDETNPPELLTTGIYVMSNCPDGAEFLDVYTHYMRSEEYWVAHTALQASIRLGQYTPEVKAAYRFMLEKYKNTKHEEMIANNIDSGRRKGLVL